MKKRTRQRWGKVGYCFLAAAFVVMFIWSRAAMNLSIQEQSFLNGYVTCVKHAEQLRTPLKEQTGITQPIWATPLGETWPMKEY